VTELNKIEHSAELQEEIIRRMVMVKYSNSVSYPLFFGDFTLGDGTLYDSDIVSLIDMYEKQRWLHEDSLRQGLFLRVIRNYRLRYNQTDTSILDKVVDLYHRAGVSLNTGEKYRVAPEYGYGTLADIAKYSTIQNVIFAIQAYAKDGLPIHPLTAINIMRNLYYRSYAHNRVASLIDTCLINGVPLCGPEQDDLPGRLSCYLSASPRAWQTVKTVIDLHLHSGIRINIGNILARNIARWYGIEAVRFILQYNTADELMNGPCHKDCYHDTMSFMDVIIAYNSLESLKLCLSKGLRICVNQFRHDVLGMPDNCTNGQILITTDDICLWRYKMTSTELQEAAMALTKDE
jgi:hypothetical protein